MTSDIEPRRFICQPDRIFESLAVCHQRCRSQYAFTMRMHDSGIHIGREAKIIGVDDQPLQIKKCVAGWLGTSWDSHENPSANRATPESYQSLDRIARDSPVIGRSFPVLN